MLSTLLEIFVEVPFLRWLLLAPNFSAGHCSPCSETSSLLVSFSS